MDNYSGTANADFNIVAKAVTPTIETIADQTYTGSQITPEVVVKDGSVVLTLDTDYTVSYGENVNVANGGTATVTLMDNYSGTANADFNIVAKAVTPTIETIADQTYTGSQITPEVVVKDGSVVLTLDTDYTVSYGENVNVANGGTATVTLMDNYSGTANANFVIIKAPGLDMSEDVIGSYVVDGDYFTYTITAIAGAEYSIDGVTFQDSNEFTGFNAGDVITFSARMKEVANYLSGAIKEGVPVVFEKQINPTIPTSFEMTYAVDYDSETFTITIPVVEGAEYSFDGTTWSEVNTLTGVDINSTVTGYVRMKETPVYVTGENITTSTITTPMYKYPVVSFDTNEGELDGEALVEVDRDGYLISLPTATKLGYLFDGWYTANNIMVKIGDIYTEDTTLYAKWTGKPTVITSGNNQVITQGDTLSVTSDGEFSLFEQVLVDGKVVDAKHYTVVEGSIVVTLNGEYTQTLSVGTHELTVVSAGTMATTTFTVKAPESVITPTGDTTSVVVWMLLLVTTGTIMTVTRKRKEVDEING